jgi:hypothetical protein
MQSAAIPLNAASATAVLREHAATPTTTTVSQRLRNARPARPARPAKIATTATLTPCQYSHARTSYPRAKPVPATTIPYAKRASIVTKEIVKILIAYHSFHNVRLARIAAPARSASSACTNPRPTNQPLSPPRSPPRSPPTIRSVPHRFCPVLLHQLSPLPSSLSEADEESVVMYALYISTHTHTHNTHLFVNFFLHSRSFRNLERTEP